MSRLRPVSKRRQKRDRVYAQRRREVHERADGRCEFYRRTAGPGSPVYRCLNRMTDVHHVRGRNIPDPHNLLNLKGLCREHHDFIHAHPAWARENGWMVSRLADAEGEAYDGPGAA